MMSNKKIEEQLISIIEENNYYEIKSLLDRNP